VRFQSAVTFVASRTADQRRPMLEHFLRAFRKGARDYHDAFTGPGEIRQDGPTAPEILAIIGKYTGETPERLSSAIAYCPPNGELDSKDILRQIDWFKAQGMLKGPIDGAALIDRRYVSELPVR
jgi:NitT/TauT family transport system substrate-binding protein